MVLSLVISVAHAGDGPWTLNPGEDSLFIGVNTFRYGEFDNGEGATSELGDGVTATGAVAVFTTGVADGIEAEFVVPYERVRVNDRQAASCTNRPADFCRHTAGIGDVSATVKFRLLNEAWRSPVTVSTALGARSGELYSEHRGRLTTLGDGQTDVGAGLSLGRSDVLGSRGWYRVGAWGWYWYRFPHAGDTWADKVPADEVQYSAEATVSLHPRFGFGPAIHGFHRLGGVDLGDADLGTDNAWSQLQAAQVQVGGKVGLYADRRSYALAVTRTVWARNNPTDTLVITAGVGWFWAGGMPLLRRGA